MLLRKKCFFASLAFLCGAVSVDAAISISKSGGWLESAYVEWTNDSQYDSYNVYCKSTSGAYEKIDDALVRNYGATGRADVLGLSAGDYQLKVVPASNGSEVSASAVETSSLTVLAHDRSGFAFSGQTTPGAYQADGTLKSGAVVLYVTESNKDKIPMEIITSSKGDKTSCTGIVAILTAIKKGYETRPFSIRFIGDVTNGGLIGSSSDFKGDIMVDLSAKNDQSLTTPMTIEGVGIDATANGWGVRLKNANYVEVRNLGFINCDSNEGDNIGLQQGNNYVWVHHNDMFYGNAGSDADQVKGDGALDCKKSNWITFSYNHFVDNGKCNLLGLSEGIKSYEDNAYYITYHHNWYDHSDSRHPRCRFYNAHVYNNYYDGNAKYGAGSTLGSSVYMQNNYFRNCKYPMLTSMQGSDLYATSNKRSVDNATFSKEDGGTIKAYGNVMVGSYYFIPYNASYIYTDGKEEASSVRGINTSEDFDAIVVDDPSKEISNSITSYEGANYYSNFDIIKDEVKNANVDATEDVVSVVTGAYGAGRLEHGDISWTFKESDDESYNVDEDLKALVTNYTSTLVGFYGEVADTSSSGGDTEVDPTDPDTPDETEPVVVKGMTCYFTGGTPSNPTFYTFLNGNYAIGKDKAVVNDTTYEDGLKMESATSITFTTTETSTITLVFGSTNTPSVKLDDVVNTKLADATISGNVLTIKNVTAGTHTLTKSNTCNLYYISVSYDSSTGVSLILQEDAEELEGPIFDCWGRRHDKSQLKPMYVYINNGNRFMIKR